MNVATVADGLFEATTDGAAARLIGTRCTACSTVYFPQAPSCRNPDCRPKTIERTVLPDRGLLISYTVQHYRPPLLFRCDDWDPYAIGLVDLGGVEVMGLVTGDLPAIGSAMRVVGHRLYDDASRGPVLTYAFRAAA